VQTVGQQHGVDALPIFGSGQQLFDRSVTGAPGAERDAARLDVGALAERRHRHIDLS
jgi:hypothetical protein